MLLDGAASDPGAPADDAYFDGLRPRVDGCAERMIAWIPAFGVMMGITVIPFIGIY